MSIPIRYNLRNLLVRRWTTGLACLSIALSVAVFGAALALAGGLRSALEGAGSPVRVLALSGGSTSELISSISKSVYQDARLKTGIAVRDGEQLSSPEVVTVADVPAKAGAASGIENFTVRGMLPVGVALRQPVKLASGGWFAPGRREIVLGAAVAERSGLRPGQDFPFGRNAWKVVGILQRGHSTFDTEIWTDLNQLASDLNRTDGYSSILFGTAAARDTVKLAGELNDDTRLDLSAYSEGDFYRRQMIAAIPIQAAGMLVAIVMGVGSAFCAMNTMFAAVLRRSREIGTLRTLGFSRTGILCSFACEGLLLALISGAVGCLAVIPLRWVTVGLNNFMSFTYVQFTFHFTPVSAAVAMTFALFIGGAGAVIPAIGAARKQILPALRQY